MLLQVQPTLQVEKVQVTIIKRKSMFNISTSKDEKELGSCSLPTRIIFCHSFYPPPQKKNADLINYKNVTLTHTRYNDYMQ